MNDFKEACRLMDNREDQYAYLIDLGKQLPAYDDAHRTDICLIKGCASKVYLNLSWDADDKLVFHADSDSSIIKGVLYLIYRELNNHSRSELASKDMKDLLTDAGLFSLLTAQRQNGLNAILDTVHHFIHT